MMDVFRLSFCAALGLSVGFGPAMPAAAFEFGDPSKIDAHRLITVLNGTTVQVGFWGVINPDCTSGGPIRPLLVSPPAHGRVRFDSAQVVARFHPADRRALCNGRKFRGLRVSHAAQRGYSGDDSYQVHYFMPNGVLIRASVSVDVR